MEKVSIYILQYDGKFSRLLTLLGHEKNDTIYKLEKIMALKTYDDKVIYLANIVSIARADGSISPKEIEAIETIQKSIKARKTELTKAYNTAESQNYEINPVGHWSDKVNNLEDMIFVSAIDGTIDNKEKPSILKFAKLINIKQDQLKYILADVQNEIASLTKEMKCPKCNAKINGIVKFCPECGTLIQEELEKQTVQVSYEIPKSGISIEFAESTAAGFANAVKEQQKAPLNSTCLKGKKTWYLATWPKEEILQLIKIVDNTKGMRNRKTYVDGVETRWDEVFGFAWCIGERNSAYRPMEYCFGIDEKQLNIWGCKQSRMPWEKWSDWFGYGTFKSSGLLGKRVNFVFDKKRIRHELETNLFGCRYCPYLRFDLIEAVLTELPDEVTPTDKGPWIYKKDYNESPGAIKVKMKILENGYTYTDEYYSSGVVPKSVNTGIQILKKAFNACGYKMAETKALLEFKG